MKNEALREIVLETVEKLIGRRIRQVRGSLNMNTEDFGEKIGVKGGAVRNWEAGSSGISAANLQALQEVYGVNKNWLLRGIDEMFIDNRASSIHKTSSVPPGAVKYVGSAMAADSEVLQVLATLDKGGGKLSVETSKVLERIPLPSVLKGREGAYGLFISNRAMAPALRYGDIAWVDPILPPSIDTEVVVYAGGDAGGDAMIGTLFAYDDNEWTIELLSPSSQIRLGRDEWPLCHRIVGKNARR